MTEGDARGRAFFGHLSDTKSPGARSALDGIGKGLIFELKLVAGRGFEPLTFRL
jgi:hypothetical protein